MCRRLFGFPRSRLAFAAMFLSQETPEVVVPGKERAHQWTLFIRGVTVQKQLKMDFIRKKAYNDNYKNNKTNINS